MYIYKGIQTLNTEIGTSKHKEKYYVLESSTGMIERLSCENFSKEYVENNYKVTIK